jgi:hypothetical protein
MIYFISGHRDIKKDEFYKWYVPELEKVLKNDLTATFVVGDYWGADKKAQDWLNKNLEDKSRVTVYHMFSEPRNLVSKSFRTKGGFHSDIERDAAMTNSSDKDIAFIRKGRWTSGTAQNILRRYEKE